MKKYVPLFVVIAVFVIIGGTSFAVVLKSGKPKSIRPIKTNFTVDTTGKQVIPITAKGGYTPSETTAKAEVPAVLRFSTSNTFDCSSALIIPILKIEKNLPINGDTDIELPAQKAGTELSGTCTMGMYGFKVKFS